MNHPRSKDGFDTPPVAFHDRGSDETLSCPCCSIALGVIEFELDPQVRIERCTGCYGLFFSPGEMEALLEAKTNPLGWLDPRDIRPVLRDLDREPFYRPCPMCSERMTHVNLGGKSGIIIERCGTHGIWLESGNLRRLTEWWWSGGKQIHLQRRARAEPIRGAISPAEEPRDWSWVDPGDAAGAVVEGLLGLLSSLAD